jgi:hypothetical protein
MRGILIVSLFIFSNYVNAQEKVYYRVHPYWRMLTCAGFSYDLVLNNEDNSFILETATIEAKEFSSYYKGSFAFSIEDGVAHLKLIFENMEIKYYLKHLFNELSANPVDYLTDDEMKYICSYQVVLEHPEYIDTHIKKDKKYPAESLLFIESIEVKNDLVKSSQLYKDLAKHCFVYSSTGGGLND